MRRVTLLLGLAAMLLGAFVMQTGGVRANGVPQLVKLTYLEGVSNSGPKDAEGVLEFSFAEAYARVEVKNLKPVAGKVFEGWLAGGEGEPISIGPIPVQPSGVGALETKLEGLERYDYNLFIVTIRPESAHGGALPAERSIAGRFTVISDNGEEGPGGDVRPSTLPETGEPAPGWEWGRIVTTGMVMAGTALAAFGILRRRGRKLS